MPSYAKEQGFSVSTAGVAVVMISGDSAEEPVPFEPTLSGLDSAVAWLRDSGLSARDVGALFGTTATHVRVMTYRYHHSFRKQPVHPYLTEPLLPPRDAFGPPNAFLRKQLGVRPHEDSVVLTKFQKTKLADLEEQVEGFAASLLQEIQYEKGLPSLHAVLPRVGFAAHYKRIRLFARLRHLISEFHQHSGRSASAIDQALRAVHLSRIAYHESGDRFDLDKLAKSALVASLAHQVRAEPEMCKAYLDLHAAAADAAGSRVSADYYRQLGVVHFQLGEHEEARRHLKRASEVLPDTIEPSHELRQYDILSFTARNLYLLEPVNWEGMQELFQRVLDQFPVSDIRVSMHLNSTAACGFSIDSPSANIKARELLEQHEETSTGFGHQATRTKLLRMTLELPRHLRRSWARRALYENALRNQ